MQYRLLLTGILLCCCTALHADTLHVYFPVDIAFINGNEEKQLARILPAIKDKKHLLVIGYADEDGDAYYNDMLSLRRARSVAEYLYKNGINEGAVKLCLGKGEINRPGDDETKKRKDRRVDIVSLDSEPKPVSPPKPPPPKPTPPPKPVVKEIKPDTPVNIAAKMEEMEVGESIQLRNIQFYPGSPVPLPTSTPEMDTLYEIMEDRPSLVIQIEGHICCRSGLDTSTDGEDYGLSVARARTVYQFLVARGIKASRMTFKGFSSWKKLVDPEITEEDRIKNRRVEIRIMKK